MNHRPGCVGSSALSSTPSTMHLRPIFWMLPSAFSSIVVRPPAMLPLVGCESDGLVVAVALDAVGGDGLPRGGDAVGDFLRPAVLDADDDHRGHVRIRAGADQRAEMELEIRAELQAPVRVRQRDRALDAVFD